MKAYLAVIIAAILVTTTWGQERNRRTRTVSESKRQIPVAYDVDVIVVGGTTRGVAAAEAAAEGGAKVFLAAQRPYLGVDLCGTYRLWLEGDEEPTTELGKAIFSGAGAINNRISLPYAYEASLPADAKHPDPKNTVLTDGKASTPNTESVQYNGNVTIIADLGKIVDFTGINLTAFVRPADFDVARIDVSYSTDKTKWSEYGLKKGYSKKHGSADFVIDANATARYVRIEVERRPGTARVLLGELKIYGAKASAKVAAAKQRRPVTPMAVKKALDATLIANKVDFLYGSYATELLRDESGALGGIVITNRSGRQAIRGKIVIDATDRGQFARIAGAEFAPYPAGDQTFKRIVVGGKPGQRAKPVGIKHVISSKASYAAHEYELTLPMRDGSWRSFARADQEARNQTWQAAQVAASEILFQIPPDPVKSRSPQTGNWPGVDNVSLDAMRPATVPHVYVLGGCADVSREAAAALLRPLSGIQLGHRVGKVAATEAKARALTGKVQVAGTTAQATIEADVGEMLDGLRWRVSDGAISSPDRALDVIARYDTVVVGGGTGGAPAGIGSARGGARTLVIEYLYGLGGVGTIGRISKYYHGNRVGFTSEVDKGTLAMSGGKKSNKGWNIEAKQEWFRSEIVKAGGDVWFNCLGAGSVVRGKRFVGVVVATPHGRGIVLANSVIDATGNAVIPACAGLPTQRITGEHVSVQGTGLPPMTPGESYRNSDWTFVDDDDVLDMWRINVVAKEKYRSAFDLGQLIDTRARRRIIGDVMVSPMDVINKRVYPDVITVSKSNFDNHGFSSHDLFMVTAPDKKGLVGNVPYRALLPKGYDGILVTGLGMSAHGDALPVLRMQPDVQNHGYAAGRASAMVAEAGTTVRNVDVKALQKHLVEIGTIPASFVGAKDSYPYGPEKLATAVEAIGKDYSGIAVVLTQAEAAKPLLRDAYKSATDDAVKLRLAHVLGMLYDDAGVDSLIKAVGEAKWDKGWNFRGMGQFGATTSHMDNIVIALGRTGDKNALPVLIQKVQQLDAKSEFSHCRAVAMALENLRSPQAAPALAALLQKDGIQGHAFLEITNVIERSPASMTDNTTRNNSLRELILARALYRCGDHNGLAKKILKQYGADFRGHYATHAKAVLNESI